MIFQFTLLTSLIALVTAYISEYAFGLLPCHLCSYERIPYFIGAIIAIFYLLSKKAEKFSLTLLVLTFLGSIILSFYHVGVEFGWFYLPEACNLQPMNSIEDMQRLIQSMPVRCDRPAIIILGITMAGWNLIWSLFIFFVIITLIISGAKKNAKTKKTTRRPFSY
jgi:disulfide bond formation protein DsbB